MKWAAAFLAVVLAFVPLLAAETFSASSINATWTSLRASGDVLEYRHEANGDTFRLDAEAVHFESDSSRWIMYRHVAFGTREPQTETVHFGPSNWTGSTWNGASDLFVIGGDAIMESASGQGEVKVPTVPCVARPTYFASPRPNDCPDAAQFVQVAGTAATWTLRGNFTLALWSWKGTVQASGTTSDFWSGSRPTNNSMQGQGEIEMRLAFLFVTNGVLELQPAADQPINLYSANVELYTESPSVVSDGRTQDANVAGINGQTGIQVRRSDDALRIDANNAALIGPARPTPPTIPGWPVGALGMSMILVPVLGIIAWRHLTLSHLVLAAENLDIGNHRAAARHAQSACRRRDLRRRACVIGAVACIKSSNFGQAERFLVMFHRLRWHDEAACRYLWAHLRVKQGRAEQGQALLEECLRLDASYRDDAALDPVLAPHLDPTLWPGQA